MSKSFTQSQIGEFVFAARTGDVVRVAHWILEGMSPSVRADDSTTALFAACSQASQNLEVIQFLLKAKANPNQMVTGEGTRMAPRTPLHAAIKNASLPAVKSLLDSGADPRIVDSDLATAGHALLTAAPFYFDRARFEKIEDAESSFAAVLIQMLDKGLPINQLDGQQQSLLHKAIYFGVPKQVIELLLDRGAKVDLYDRDGRRALHEAVQGDRIDVVDLLLMRGADPHVPDHQGETPLWFVHSIETGRILLDAGVDVNARDIHGRSVLSWKLSDLPNDSTISPCVRLLVEAGADLDLADHAGLLCARTMIAKHVTSAQRRTILAMVGAREARLAIQNRLTNEQDPITDRPRTVSGCS